MTIEPAQPPRAQDTTRQRILDAALELFAAQGFDATTVRAIAQRVGLRDAALYYHFANKREILTSLWDSPFGPEGALNVEGPFTDEQLDTLTELALQFTVTNDHLLRLICRETLGGDQTASALRLQNRALIRRTLQERFGTIFEPDEAEIRADSILALLTGISLRGQIELGNGYAAAASSPEFIERTTRQVRALARLDEVEAAG